MTELLLLSVCLVSVPVGYLLAHRFNEARIARRLVQTNALVIYNADIIERDDGSIVWHGRPVRGLTAYLTLILRFLFSKVAVVQVSVHFRGQPFSTHDANLLSSLSGLRYLSFDGLLPPADALIKLTRCRRLSTIMLIDISLDNAHVEALCKLTAVREVRLRNVVLSAEQLDTLTHSASNFIVIQE
jgi:hypothetical protein